MTQPQRDLIMREDTGGVHYHQVEGDNKLPDFTVTTNSLEDQPVLKVKRTHKRKPWVYKSEYDRMENRFLIVTIWAAIATTGFFCAMAWILKDY